MCHNTVFCVLCKINKGLKSEIIHLKTGRGTREDNNVDEGVTENKVSRSFLSYHDVNYKRLDIETDTNSHF